MRTGSLSFAVCLWWTATAASAATVTAEVPVPKDLLYRTAKAYILSEFSDGGGSTARVIPVEDPQAGLLRFRFRDGEFSDDGALCEVIDLEPSRSRLRVTIPKDFKGRDQFMADEIRRSSLRRHEGKEGREIRFEARRAFQSVRRWVLREFLRDSQARERVILVEDEGVALLRFVYSEDGFRDPGASVQVIPLSDGGSRLIVSLPRDPEVRQKVLEDRLASAIAEDLGKP